MEWININNKLPEDDSSVLVVANYKGNPWVDLADYNCKYFEQEGFWINENGGEYSTELEVTHWMPLPELPK